MGGRNRRWLGSADCTAVDRQGDCPRRADPPRSAEDQDRRRANTNSNGVVSQIYPTRATNRAHDSRAGTPWFLPAGRPRLSSFRQALGVRRQTRREAMVTDDWWKRNRSSPAP